MASTLEDVRDYRLPPASTSVGEFLMAEFLERILLHHVDEP